MLFVWSASIGAIASIETSMLFIFRLFIWALIKDLFNESAIFCAFIKYWGINTSVKSILPLTLGFCAVPFIIKSAVKSALESLISGKDIFSLSSVDIWRFSSSATVA